LKGKWRIFKNIFSIFWWISTFSHLILTFLNGIPLSLVKQMNFYEMNHDLTLKNCIFCLIFKEKWWIYSIFTIYFCFFFAKFPLFLMKFSLFWMRFHFFLWKNWIFYEMNHDLTLKKCKFFYDFQRKMMNILNFHQLFLILWLNFHLFSCDFDFFEWNSTFSCEKLNFLVVYVKIFQNHNGWGPFDSPRVDFDNLGLISKRFGVIYLLNVTQSNFKFPAKFGKYFS